jgi:manganese transport protein
MSDNPYVVTDDAVLDPPPNFKERLRYLGPGLILSASIVGSGELIATTALGAKAGFITLWVIIISCLAKVTLQLEFGKHAICNGESVMASFDRLPGPRFGPTNWIVWLWLLIMVPKFLQMGGVLGGVAQALHMTIPGLSVLLWCLIAAVVTGLLVFRGYYNFIQQIAIIMIACFTVYTITCVAFLQFTPYAVSLSDLVQGLEFQLPAFAVGVAIGAFGITGVGGDEIMHYVYWCIEKGYASHCGPGAGYGLCTWMRSFP